ncbi:DsbA family protein [Parvularcula sp. LCG005]|uniref:DsbA family protein n=1 Tax=Parvularcula sp. LCG005 TaxID=3078805 RepID=UPI00294339BF|nr:DsbA family protein [Parvularcula sp. LCG005]WOI52833.1 DsbA family protein [Parvularcula sp. LCG005]
MRRLFALPLLASIALVACGGSDSADSAEETTTAAPTETAAPSASEQADAAPASERVVAAPEGSQAGNAMVLGSPDAPVKIIEYASVVCPACAYFHTEVLSGVRADYIDTGKVSIEFREFPTNPQNLAYAGFYLARCAATQKGSPAYFKMLGTLFERQREWAYGPTPGAVLENIAAQAGINREGLEECFYREDVKSAVKANIVSGHEEFEVSKTPTLFIDGEEISWGKSAEEFAEILDAELAKKAEQ